MHSIKSILLSLAVAAVVSAQAGTQIVDGQIQVPTSSVVLPKPPIVTAPIVTAKPSATLAPTVNGTFTTGAPTGKASTFPGAANMMVWSKEIAVGAVGVAVGFAML